MASLITFLQQAMVKHKRTHMRNLIASFNPEQRCKLPTILEPNLILNHNSEKLYLEIQAGQKVLNVVTKTCEPGAKCNRDQQGFKAIYLRNLAYTYREATSDQVKGVIKSTIDASVAAMVQYSCDNDCFCNGNWTADATLVKYVRSQHVAAALLVSALGVHLSPEGGLLPKITPGQLTDTTNGAAGLGSSCTKNPGKVTSKPLAAASRLKVTFSSIFLGLFTVAFSTSIFDPLAFIP
ncbi:hypothetical protein PtA15_18A85 [Puccinia triticina]|uniref:Uncharacterized protein n=1 Tax=Puccinia triticina TaxID=208348 RepID=A0ABY7D5U6_9BASI|nr:uncharacterized protein PtA15_18A85 [Puccinia triticina]WAQ93029.1 hypothetical protein PtA15_18A85 [Puccinia triticina]